MDKSFSMPWVRSAEMEGRPLSRSVPSATPGRDVSRPRAMSHVACARDVWRARRRSRRRTRCEREQNGRRAPWWATGDPCCCLRAARRSTPTRR
eukprot:7132882-Pyramimonas_sp.AAC.2